MSADALSSVTATPESATADVTSVLRCLMPELLAYFVRRLENSEDAADAVSETMLVLWRRRAMIAGRSEDVRRYAYGVARMVLATARRGRLRRRALADRLAIELAGVLAVPVPGYVRDEELHAALASLPGRDRELVMLVAWEGFGVAEAGALLGVRPDAARTRYSRARARLRAALSSPGIDPRPH